MTVYVALHQVGQTPSGKRGNTWFPAAEDDTSDELTAPMSSVVESDCPANSTPSEQIVASIMTCA